MIVNSIEEEGVKIQTSGWEDSVFKIRKAHEIKESKTYLDTAVEAHGVIVGFDATVDAEGCWSTVWHHQIGVVCFRQAWHC